MSFAQAWKQADISTDQTNNDPPEPGLYDVAITDAKAFVSKAGNEVLVVEFRVVSGAQTGYEWPEMRGFKTEGQIKAAKAMCSRIGVNVDEIGDFGDLDPAIKRFVGLYYQVEVVQNGDYRNVYVQKALTPGEPGTMNLPASDVDSDTSDFEHPKPAGGDDDPGW